MTDGRYDSRHMMFDLDALSFSEDKMSDFVLSSGLKDFIVLNPSVTKTNRYRCYGTRQGESRFNFKKGSKTLAKKLKVDPSTVSLIQVGRNHKMPDHFFNLLDPNQPFDDQIAMAVGRYAQHAMIKAHIDTSLKQNKNRQVTSKIKSKGALEAVESGVLSVGQLKSAKAYEAELAKRAEKKERLSRDIPKGEYIEFSSFRTGIKYFIRSELGESCNKGEHNNPEARLERTVKDEGITIHKVVGHRELFTKRKHYYFYSKSPGYGKTTFVGDLVKYTNATKVVDVNNWTGVLEDAHFLIIDEYGKKDNRLSLDKLKRLTSGDASTFAGNRKSYGSSYVPRADSQLIMFSNHHLFDSMGTKDKADGYRKVSEADAAILSDRFFIYRLDEIKRGEKLCVEETEEADRMRHTEGREDDLREWRENLMRIK